MARKAGRKASFEIYRYHAPNTGEPYGNYRCYSPVHKSVVDLGSDDEHLALAAVEKLRAEFGGVKRSPVAHEYRDRPDAAAVAQAATPTTPTVDPFNALNTYLNQTAPLNTDTPPETYSNPDPSPSFTPVSAPKRTKGLTPEQSEKISQALSKIVARTNVVLAEIAVSVTGRKVNDNLELDDEDLAVLKLGWEMQLEQWFVKSHPEPWHLLLAGNVFILFILFKNSEKKPKKRSPAQTDDIVVTE